MEGILMSYIVMGTDECGSDFRPSKRTWFDAEDAYNELQGLREQFPEALNLWVEVLQDKAYFQTLRDQNRDYWDYEDY
jgi:hypothetical protein